MDALVTARLTLRRFTEEDAGFVLRLLNEPSFLHFIGDRGVRTLDDARRYLRDGPLASYERHGFGLYLVALAADSTPIGMCGLIQREELADVDVGFAFLPEHWSRGYAFEAAAAVVEEGKRTFGLERIAAITTPDNAGSIRVLEKLGLRYERRVRLDPGEPELLFFARAL
jgi:RimJ/RimL family protein N-acetyltransferase